MPESPDWCRKIFMTENDDGILKAEERLEENFNINNGLITRKVHRYIETQEEYEALVYLVHEWDYGYE